MISGDKKMLWPASACRSIRILSSVLYLFPLLAWLVFTHPLHHGLLVWLS
jgi:hypothetical protein